MVKTVNSAKLKSDQMLSIYKKKKKRVNTTTSDKQVVFAMVLETFQSL